MQFTNFMDKYPAHHTDISKIDTRCTSVDEIIAFLRNKVENDARACVIGEFDHYAHTKSLADGEVAADIHAAKHLIFCFGIKLPNPLAMAARPRSIGVCEMDDSFAISFLEAPNPMMHNVMLEWVAELKDAKKA